MALFTKLNKQINVNKIKAEVPITEDFSKIERNLIFGKILEEINDIKDVCCVDIKDIENEDDTLNMEIPVENADLTSIVLKA